MPMQRDLYPSDWDAIARQVKSGADWHCEQCGKACIRSGEAIAAFIERIRTTRMSECPVVANFLQAPQRFLLTVAHLDHVPANCDRANLKALCTVCHCRYDLRQMATKRRLKAERLGQLTLSLEVSCTH